MLRNRVNRVLATIGIGAAFCAFPVALAATTASGNVRAAAAAYAAPSAPATNAAHTAHTARGMLPGIAFPIPTQGPPRQFPIGPTSTPTPKPPPRKQAPPPPPRPIPPRPKPAPVAPRPVVRTPKPTPKPPPKPIPVVVPAPQPPLPALPYHTVPPHHLSTVLVVFVVAIVPVSLARVRR